MNRLFSASLLSVLYLVNIVIVISQETASIDNNNKNIKYNCGIKGKRPNIILILADDMGWNDVSFHGSDQIPTPNIDAIAYNGIILNNHYVQPMCTPSRSALLTGKYPIRMGMQHYVLYQSEPRGLPLKEKLLPQYLKKEHYKTHLVGKWHLGYYKKEYTPTYRGFDTHFGYWNGLQDYFTHSVVDPFLSIFNLKTVEGFDMRRNLSVAWDTRGKYSTDLFTEEAVRLINAHDTNDPMFLFLSHLAPHSGNENNLVQAPDEEIAKFSYITDPNRRTYAAMVSKLDQSVGEVLTALNNRKMLDNSIILFMSDNGAPTEGQLHNYGSNYPLRGIKDSPWEGAVRGAAAIWSPLIKERERVSNQLMSIVDWLPTLLCAAGVSEKKIPKLDGINMWPALQSDKLKLRQEVLITIDEPSLYSAIRLGDYKYVKGGVKNSKWVGDSGRSASENRSAYDPDEVLNSQAGIAISQTIKQMKEEILSSDKILQLRNQAVVNCSVTEKEKIPCNTLLAPCLYNITNDPCEMINIAEVRPYMVVELAKALLKYELSAKRPSNKLPDLSANPKYWNNTWTCWRD